MKFTNGESTTEKPKTTTYKSLVIGLSIILAAFLVYLHDFTDSWRGMEGFSGFSSLRVALYHTFLLSFALYGWFRAFIESKGKIYRVTYIVPIVMVSYQLLVYLLDARDTTTNEFSTKIIFQVLVLPTVLFLTYYFGKKLRKKGDE